MTNWQRVGRATGSIYVLLLLGFLILPFLIMIPASFDSAAILTFPPRNFSFTWYSQVLESSDWRGSARTSLIVSISAGAIATFAGLLLGIVHLRFGRVRTSTRTYLMLPLVVPSILIGTGLFGLLLQAQLLGRVWVLALADAALALPVVVIVLLAAFETVDPLLWTAASAIGARSATIIRQIILPVIAASVVVALIIAFHIAWDEVIMALWIGPAIVPTLTNRMFASLQQEGVSPALTALATMLLAVTLILVGGIRLSRQTALSRCTSRLRQRLPSLRGIQKSSSASSRSHDLSSGATIVTTDGSPNGELVASDVGSIEISGTTAPRRRSLRGGRSGGEQDAVEVERVSKSFGDVRAVNDVSFVVKEGELVSLLGPSGSGKTTILSLLVGAESLYEGVVRIGGRDLVGVPVHKRDIGIVFQRYTLFPNKTVGENVAFPLRVRHLSPAEINAKVGMMLELVGLSETEHRYPSQISGGQAQRVAVARALVYDPAVMLMDEPLGALDRALRQTLQQEIRRIQQDTQVPTLYVTHDQEEAMNLSDRIVIIRDGEIVAQGTPRDLYEQPPSGWVAQFLGDANFFPIEHWSMNGGRSVTCRSSVLGEIPARIARNGDLQPGDQAVVILRPENCLVSTAPLDFRWTQRGVLTRCTYLGATQRLEVRLPAGLELVSTTSPREAFAVGDEVYVGWADESAMLVRPL
jgi:putative spermidine/putrescine transport system ATP-binding protein